jgi:hypothetical protein
VRVAVERKSPASRDGAAHEQDRDRAPTPTHAPSSDPARVLRAALRAARRRSAPHAVEAAADALEARAQSPFDANLEPSRHDAAPRDLDARPETPDTEKTQPDGCVPLALPAPVRPPDTRVLTGFRDGDGGCDGTLRSGEPQADVNDRDALEPGSELGSLAASPVEAGASLHSRADTAALARPSHSAGIPDGARLRRAEPARPDARSVEARRREVDAIAATEAGFERRRRQEQKASAPDAKASEASLESAVPVQPAAAAGPRASAEPSAVLSMAGDAGADSVSAWQAKASAQALAITAPDITEGDRYVAVYHAASAKREELSAQKKLQLIQQARAAAQPPAEMEKPPPVPQPDAVPAARTLVESKCYRPLTQQRVPALDRTPFGTIPELNTFLLPDKGGGDPHIIREIIPGAKFAEIHVLGPGQPAPRSIHGFDPELRRPSRATPAKGTLAERVRAINERQSQLVLKRNPKAGQSFVIANDQALQAPKVPDFAKVDIKGVLAKVLAQPTRHAKKICDDAWAAYPGASAAGKAGYADEFIADVRGDVEADLARVRAASGVVEADLAQAIDAEKAKLAAQADAAETKAQAALSGAARVAKSTNQILDEHITNVRTDIDLWLDDISAEANGGYDPEQVRKEESKLLDANKARVDEWLSKYEAMRTRRHVQLEKARSQQVGAYEAAAEIDRRQLRLAAGKLDPQKDKAKADELAAGIQKIDDWLNGTADDLGKKKRVNQLFTAYHDQADVEVDQYLEDLKAAGTKAQKMIEAWAHHRINKELGLLRQIIDAILDWLGITRKKVRVWETKSVADNNATLNEDMLYLAQAKLEFAKGLNQKQLDAQEGLSEEQRAILKTYFLDTKGDAVSALAAGLVARLSSQRRPGLFRRIEEKLLRDDLPTLMAVADAQGGPSTSMKVSQLMSAMRGLGTQSDQIFETLRTSNPVKSRAMELLFKQRYGESLRSELDSELYDLGEQLWGSRHDADRAIALLDARASAQDEAIAIELDQAMKGGFLGIGTKEQALFRLMRNKTARERASIQRWYKRKYDRDLLETAVDELEDPIDFASNRDSGRFRALMAGETQKADVLGMRTSLGERNTGTAESALANLVSRDPDQAAEIYDQIKKDIDLEAALPANNWTTEQKGVEFDKRIKALDKDFGREFGREYVSRDYSGSVLLAAQGQSFGHDYAKLLEGKHTRNFALESAAKISIEHKALVLPSRKTVDQTLAAQYRTAYDEELWDQEVAYRKERANAWAACKTAEERDAFHQKWDGPENEYAALQGRRDRAHKKALQRAGTNWDELKRVYEGHFATGSIYSTGSFEGDVRSATAPAAFFGSIFGGGAFTRNAETDKTEALIATKGYLTGDQILYFAVKGGGTDEDEVKYAQAGKSKAQIDEMYLALAERLGYGKELAKATPGEQQTAIQQAQGWVLDDFSGREYDDTELDMMGEAITAEQKIARAEHRRMQLVRAQQGSSLTDAVIGGLMGGPAGAFVGAELGPRFRAWIASDELSLVDDEIKHLKDAAAKVKAIEAELAKLAPGAEKEKKWAELAAAHEKVSWASQAVDAAVTLHRRTVDAFADTVTTIITIVVAVVATVVGIVLTPFTGGGSAALVTAMWIALVSSLVTTGLSMAAKAIIKGGAYGWEEAAYDAIVGVIEAVAAAATANLGDKFVKAAFLAKMTEGGLLSRLASHGVANAMEGVLQALPGALVGAIANDETWKGGNAFFNILSAMGTQVALSGAMSGGMGAFRGWKKAMPQTPHAPPVEPTKAVEKLLDQRFSARERMRLWKAYKVNNPGVSLQQFSAELDQQLLRLNSAAFADAGVQRKLRKQLLEGLPIAQRKALVGARIDVVGADRFRSMFGDVPDGAVVLWRRGKPLVFASAGTDLGALGQRAPQLFHPPEPAGPLGRPRGASASPDPKAPVPGVEPKVIVEVYAGPNLDSAVDLAARHPGARIIATEATLMPDAAQLKRLNDAGGTFLPENMPSGIPIGSVDEVKMRFPLPADRAIKQDFLRHLIALEAQFPGKSRLDLAQEALALATARAETVSAYGPYALQRLKTGGTLEVVFWEPQIGAELEKLGKLRFIDPVTGKGYRFELVAHDMRIKGDVAPHSGFGVPVTNESPVSVARLRKVELDSDLPTGARGPTRPGEVVGAHSGREFFPDNAGGPVRDLDDSRIRFTDKGVDRVEQHVRRFDGGGEMELAMVERLRKIARGEIPATDFDRAFYSHELRESVRYRRIGWLEGDLTLGDRSYDIWNDLHTATLEDYKLNEIGPTGQRTLFHPDVVAAHASKPSGAQGPALTLHRGPGGPQLPPGEALPARVRRSLELELRDAGYTSLHTRALSDNELLSLHAAAQVELAPQRVAAFRDTLDSRASAQLDALNEATHLHHRPIDASIEARLSIALDTSVHIDTHLLPGQVSVHYDVGVFGRVRGVELRVGRGATLGDVLLHIPTLHAYKRYQGLTGVVRQTLDSVNALLRGGATMRANTRAREALEELRKLPGVIEARKLRLADSNLSPLTRIDLMHQIADIESQLARYVRELGDLRPGKGYVASRWSRAFAKGLSRSTEGWSDVLGMPTREHLAIIDSGRRLMEDLRPNSKQRLDELLHPSILPEEKAVLERLEARLDQLNKDSDLWSPTEARREAVMKKIVDGQEEREALIRSFEPSRQFRAARGLEEAEHIMEELRARLLADEATARAAAASARSYVITPEARQRIVAAKRTVEAVRDDIALYIRLTGDEPRVGLDYVEPRAHYDSRLSLINVGDKPRRPTILHEFAHNPEHVDTNISQGAKSFRDARGRYVSRGMDPKVFELEPAKPAADGKPAKPAVMAIRGGFIDEYSGRLYGLTEPATEVVSTGVPYFVGKEAMAHFYLQDPEHFLFTLGVIRATLAKAGR